NQEFWKDKNLPLKQEIIFASTGTKDPKLPADKYVEALAGSDIQTNPPATNAAVAKLNKTYTKKLEDKLMEEGTAKFADPHKALLKLIKEKRASLVGAK